MKTFKDLIINFQDDKTLVKFISRITTSLNHPDYTYMPDFKQVIGNSILYQIVSHVEGTHQARIIIDSPKEQNILSVINIVPYKSSVSQINSDEYNYLLDLFHERVLAPNMLDLNCQVEITSGIINIENFIPNSYPLLNSFIGSCDKNSPISHPLDRSRWFNFLCSVVENGEELSSEILQRWLIENHDFRNEVAGKLGLYYEYGFDLLCNFRNRHGYDN